MKIYTRLLVFIVLLTLLSVTTLVACGPVSTTPTDGSQEPTIPDYCQSAFPFTAKTTEVPYDLELLGGADPFAMMLSIGAADILSKYHPIIRASTVETAGGEFNIVAAVDKDPNRLIYHSSGSDYRGALLKLVPWEQAYTDQRLIAAYTWSPMGLVTWDPNIRTLADLVGKNIGSLAPDSQTTQMLYLCLEDLGIRDQVEFTYMDFGDFVDALADKAVDAVMEGSLGKPPGPVLMLNSEEFLAACRNDVYPVSFPPDVIERVSPLIGVGHIPSLWPAGSWPLQTEDAYALGFPMHILECQAGADEDLIYEITQTLVRYSYLYRDYGIVGTFVSPESMVSMLPIESETEVHPGALRYYKEVGLWGAWQPWLITE